MALKAHRDALNTMQRFWHTMLHKRVQFRTLASTVQAMDLSIRQAERVYKCVDQGITLRNWLMQGLQCSQNTIAASMFPCR
jgi:hypothetical protein